MPPPGPPVPRHARSDSVSAVTPPQPQLLTSYIAHAYSAATKTPVYPHGHPLIRLHQNPASQVAWMSSHSRLLLSIHPKANPVEEACKNIECLLKTLQLGQGNDYIFGIKLCRQVPHKHAKSLRACLCCRHQLHPVVYNGIHCCVEERRGQGGALSNSVVSL